MVKKILYFVKLIFVYHQVFLVGSPGRGGKGRAEGWQRNHDS